METSSGSQLTASTMRLALVCAFGMLALLLSSCRQYRPPLDPPAPAGISMGMPGHGYRFGAKTSDPDGDRISYVFSWGDCAGTETSGLAPSDSTVWMSHAWADTGTYDVRVLARDVYDSCSRWSPPARVVISDNAPEFSLPDVNGKLTSLYPLLATGPVYMVWWDLPNVNGIVEVDMLHAVFDSLSPHGFTLLALSVDRESDESRVRSFVASKRWRCPVLLDPGMVTKQQYGILIKPTGILVSMDTAIVYTHIGYKKGDEDSIKAQILKWMPPKARTLSQ
jgi:peroxiredoxin